VVFVTLVIWALAAGVQKKRSSAKYRRRRETSKGPPSGGSTNRLGEGGGTQLRLIYLNARRWIGRMGDLYLIHSYMSSDLSIKEIEERISIE